MWCGVDFAASTAEEFATANAGTRGACAFAGKYVCCWFMRC